MLAILVSKMRRRRRADPLFFSTKKMPTVASLKVPRSQAFAAISCSMKRAYCLGFFVSAASL